MAHIHSVYDTDSHFMINAVTRTITNMSSQKTTLMQYDHNSERFTFELPRYIEGHDMSTCNRVEVHYINIDAVTQSQNEGIYEVDDLQISPEDDNVVICSWLISQNATKFIGSIHFVVRFVCTTDSKIDYAWNTAIFSGINVSTGMYHSESVIEDYPDVLQQWYDTLISVGVNGVVDARNQALDDIETATIEKVELLVKTGGTIVSENEPEGEHIDIWVNPSTEGEDVILLESSDIVQELSDATDKVPSVDLVSRVANDCVRRDANGDIPLNDDETWISNCMPVAVSGVAVKAYIDDVLGVIDTALDAIIEMDNALIGGDA